MRILRRLSLLVLLGLPAVLLANTIGRLVTDENSQGTITLYYPVQFTALSSFTLAFTEFKLGPYAELTQYTGGVFTNNGPSLLLTGSVEEEIPYINSHIRDFSPSNKTPNLTFSKGLPYPEIQTGDKLTVQAGIYEVGSLLSS